MTLKLTVKSLLKSKHNFSYLQYYMNDKHDCGLSKISFNTEQTELTKFEIYLVSSSDY